eukprot:SAG11_NODE_27_length_23309_cov_10.579362_27_plen_366_part_00
MLAELAFEKLEKVRPIPCPNAGQRRPYTKLTLRRTSPAQLRDDRRCVEGETKSRRPQDRGVRPILPSSANAPEWKGEWALPHRVGASPARADAAAGMGETTGQDEFEEQCRSAVEGAEARLAALRRCPAAASIARARSEARQAVAEGGAAAELLRGGSWSAESEVESEVGALEQLRGQWLRAAASHRGRRRRRGGSGESMEHQHRVSRPAGVARPPPVRPQGVGDVVGAAGGTAAGAAASAELLARRQLGPQGVGRRGGRGGGELREGWAGRRSGAGRAKVRLEARLPNVGRLRQRAMRPAPSELLQFVAQREGLLVVEEAGSGGERSVLDRAWAEAEAEAEAKAGLAWARAERLREKETARASA